MASQLLNHRGPLGVKLLGRGRSPAGRRRTLPAELPWEVPRKHWAAPLGTAPRRWCGRVPERLPCSASTSKATRGRTPSRCSTRFTACLGGCAASAPSPSPTREARHWGGRAALGASGRAHRPAARSVPCAAPVGGRRDRRDAREDPPPHATPAASVRAPARAGGLRERSLGRADAALGGLGLSIDPLAWWPVRRAPAIACAGSARTPPSWSKPGFAQEAPKSDEFLCRPRGFCAGGACCAKPPRAHGPLLDGVHVFNGPRSRSCCCLETTRTSET